MAIVLPKPSALQCVEDTSREADRHKLVLVLDTMSPESGVTIGVYPCPGSCVEGFERPREPEPRIGFA